MDPPMTGSTSTSIKKEAKDSDIKVKDTTRSNNNEPDTSSKSKSSRRSSPGREDEEPTTTKASSKPEVRERRSASSTSRPETVDRGVGPTPAPPVLPVESRGAFFPIPPYPDPREAARDPRDPRDPRNGLLDPLGYPAFAYPHVAYPVNPPLPVTSHTHEGRYQWPPVSSPFQLGHGLSGSPTYSDLSLLGMPSRLSAGVAGDVLSPLASRLQWDQYRRMLHATPMPHRSFSSAAFPSVFLPPPTAGTSLSQRSLFTDIPPTPGSGSITLPGSAESSRLTSPRPSIISKPGRKRALSHSPFSECGLDIESLTRSSQGSLQLTPFADPHSRSSSAASGSYGHLSAGSLGPSPPHGLAGHHPLLRHAGLPGTSPFFPPLIHPLLAARQHGVHGLLPPASQVTSHGAIKHDHTPTSRQDPSSSSVVSSTVDPQNDPKKSKFKKESSEDMKCDEEGRYADPSRLPVEGEPDFVETNCHWKDCHKEFDTQDELVRHINQDHIQANKKLFVCLWDDCSREAKPFKAQYMLVVHMRRHTGEKPHNCTFEGCDKAYSRLENLKTHLRSHTGEKPYMCEFPGCTKAFSNASDRAKHQNRTHSNAKPYVCKAPGCSKRYTDPSSLRKHVKTVHGPEFYANKKHKGNDHHGGGSDRGEGDHQDGGKSVKMEDSDSCDKTDNPSSVESQQTHHNPSTELKMEQSPASTHSAYSDMDEQLGTPHLPVSGIGGGVGGVSGGHAAGDGDDEDEEDDDDADIVIPSSSSVAMATTTALRTRGAPPNRLKGRIAGKAAVSNLPPLPPLGARPTHTTITDLGDKGPRHGTHHRRLTDLMSQNSSADGSSLPSFTGRRDSNTSTLSSYLSSIRSDASPYPFNSSFSSRRSSEASQLSSNRLSIANSPYEYDITGNFPSATSRRHAVNSHTMQTVTSQMENARLGSQGSLNLPPRLPPVSSTGSARSSTSSERPPAGTAGGAGGRREGWRSSTPCRTPLPHEIPNRDVRRASDPVRAADPGFTALRRLQRFHSLNQVKPLPIPDGMKSLRDQGKADSGHNWSSSHSSIATDYSFQDDVDSSQILSESLPLRSLDEESLDLRMMEDSEDMIIPDDMQRFLNEQYQHTLGAPPPPVDSTVPEFNQDTSPGQRLAGDGPQGGSYGGTVSQPGPKPCRHLLSMTASWTSSQMVAEDEESLKSCGSCRQSQAYTPSFHHQPTPPPGSGLAARQGLSRRRLLHAQLQQPSAPSTPGPQGDMASQQMPPPAAPPPPPTPQQQQPHPPSQPQQQQQTLHHYGPHPQQHPQQQQQQQQQMGGGYCHPDPQMSPMGAGPMQSPMMQPQYPPQPPQAMYGPVPGVLMGQYGQPWPQQGMSNQQMMQQQQQAPPPYPMGPYYGAPYPPPQQHDVVTKKERDSPQVQVAQISQSQIPPRAKMANNQDRGGYPPHQQQQQQHNHALQHHPQHPQQLHHQQVMGNAQVMPQGYGPDSMGPPRGYPAYPPYPIQHANMPVQQQMTPPYSMASPPLMGPAAAMGSYAQHQQQQQQQQQHQQPQQQQQQQQQQQHQRPSCQMAGGGPSLLEMQMSPDCNRVSSTTDVKECETEGGAGQQMDAAMAPGLNSLSTENLIDNLSSISVENMHSVLSPTALIRSTSSQPSSRMTTPYNMEGKVSAQSMEASNMVVNDMSSVLTQLAEENRYFNSSLR